MKRKTEKRRIGDRGEQAAEQLLRSKEYEILSRNYRRPCGEIDIIAVRGQYIVFVEVKTRAVQALAQPAQWVSSSKQKKILRTAQLYLEETGCELQARFDVAEVVYDAVTGMIVKVRHIENAFEQAGDYTAF